MGDELLALQSYLKSDAAKSQAKVVIVTGKGDASFSTGRDLKESKTHSPEDAKRYMGLAIDSAVGFSELPMPTIAAINGHCFGWGIEVRSSV
jgi:enoyl-CoA hydratase/carnithine racemase